MSSGPYVIEAADFDPEKQERATIDDIAVEWDWKARRGRFDLDLPDMPIVVRDKPKPPTLEDSLRAHLYRAESHSCTCGWYFRHPFNALEIVRHQADAIHAAGLAKEQDQ